VHPAWGTVNAPYGIDDRGKLDLSNDTARNADCDFR
jgi:hypothetical protein